MKLTVLVDNDTYIDQYFWGEPGLSYYIEVDGRKILFDTGYSDIYIKNAEKMNIDLKSLDTIVFSHGHNDHTLGLKYLKDYMDLKNVEVIAHPLCFNEKIDEDGDLGAPFRKTEMETMCNLKLTSEPLEITPSLTFLGGIPKTNDFEAPRIIGKIKSDNCWQPDLVKDDSALVYKNEKGLFIITGCSHSGICNIVEYARNICNDDRIIGVIGGYHLFKVDERLEKTIEYFKNNNISTLYPCHCVSFKAKAKIHEAIKIHQVGVGMVLDI